MSIYMFGFTSGYTVHHLPVRILPAYLNFDWGNKRANMKWRFPRYLFLQESEEKVKLHLEIKLKPSYAFYNYIYIIDKVAFWLLEITKTLKYVRPKIALTCLTTQKSSKETIKCNNFIWIQLDKQVL